MKTKYFILPILILMFHRSDAQLTYSADIYGGASIMDTEGLNSPQIYKERPGLSESIGFSTTYFSHKHKGLYVSSGLYLSYVSAKFKFDDADVVDFARPSIVVSNYRSKNSSALISVPVVVGYKANKFSLETGLESMYNLYQQTKTTQDETYNESEIEVSIRQVVKLKNKFLLSTATNMEYKVMDRIGIRLKINVGLTNYFRLIAPTLNPDFKSRVHSAFLGLRFYL